MTARITAENILAGLKVVTGDEDEALRLWDLLLDGDAAPPATEEESKMWRAALSWAAAHPPPVN